MIARRQLLAAAVLAVAPSSAVRAAAAGLAGRWTGVWTKAGDDLAVEVGFSRSASGWSGQFDSDALQVAAIPFSEVAYDAPRLHITLKGDATTSVFDGVLDGDVIAGTFTEGEARGTFRLVRDRAAARPIRTEDVVFHDGEVSLAGTLLLPAGAGRRPGIVFLHGSGAEGRWANRYLAQRFAAAGFAALIYDKRGVGQSTGDWRKGGLEALADDGAAGVRFLRTRPDIDPARIGVWGHSQGGWLAPMVAARAGALAFVIGSAAGGVDPAAMEFYSVSSNIGVAAMPEAEAREARAYVRELVDVAFHGKNRAGLDAMAARLKDRPWYFDPPPPGDAYWTFSRRTAAFDPVRAWAAVHAPVLLVYGERDERVPPGESAAAIRAALAAAGNRDVTVRIFPEADHAFRLAARPGGWPRRPAGYDETMIAWARATTGLDAAAR